MLSTENQPDTKGLKPRRGRPPSTKKTNRLNVTFPETLSRRIEELQEETHAGSLTEVFRNSLIVYAALWEAHKRGDEIILRSQDGGKEKELAIFL